MTQINKACIPAKGTDSCFSLCFNKKHNSNENTNEKENSTKNVAVGNPMTNTIKKRKSPNPNVLFKSSFNTVLAYIKSTNTMAITILKFIKVVNINC
ncbi:MAG: hypothetical protein WC389_04625 [Lutibacter sp.]